jgi:aminomethyltransferase
VSGHTSRPTPLLDRHLALGARLIDFAGWTMPLKYGSESAEHRAVRTAVGLFDLSHMGQIEVTGPDSGAALDYALISDVAAIGVGRAKYSMLCGPNGGIVDDLIVYRLDVDRYLVVSNAANTPAVLTLLIARSADRAAKVVDRTADHALVALQGPRSADVLSRLVDFDLGQLRYYAVMPAKLCERPGLLARTGYTGEDGFEIFCEQPDAQVIWDAVTEVGQPFGLTPIGLAARDTLRLEAGMPLYGNELSVDLTPFDAGLGRVAALGKTADFVGRDALTLHSRIDPPRRLVGLIAQGRRIPRRGQLVHADGHCVGVVTSGAPSPSIGAPIAMAYLDRMVARPDQKVEVAIRNVRQPARVVELPFYRRTR